MVTRTVPGASAGTGPVGPGRSVDENRSMWRCGGGDAVVDEGLLDEVHERPGAADEHLGLVGALDERAHRVGGEEAGLGVEVVDEREAVAVLGGERVERVAEDHRPEVAVGVEHPHRSVGGGEGGLHDRDDGRDAAAGGEGHDRRPRRR